MRVFTDVFKGIVMRYPEKTAIVDMDGTRETTYGELDAMSNQVAALILEKKAAGGSCLPVLIARKMEFVAAALGVLKAGCVLVPLSSAYPEGRISFIKEQCNAPWILDEQFVLEAMKREPVKIHTEIKENDNALAVYTSGSTGKAKGIVHTHKTLYCGADRICKALGLTAQDIYLSNAPFHFIVVVIDIFSNLFQGATIHIHSEKGYKDVRRIEEYVQAHGITAFFASPQILKLYQNKSTTLRLVLTGSERLSNVCGHGYQIINIYGSSETIASTTCFKVDQSYDNTPIGTPMEGVTVYLLDADGQPVKEGEIGEICISGPKASGYLQLPEKSAETFRENPFAQGQDDRILYYSGDLGRRLPDGNLVYVNRRDWMVKINGQRVEIGDIEAQINNLPFIKTGVVKGFENQHGQTYLCGYFQLKEHANVEHPVSVMEAELRKNLPGYMIPQFFVQVEKFALNLNGKLDRLALSAPEVSIFKNEYEAPVTKEQEQLCKIFEEILSCGSVGINDDFFALGGDSIKVLMIQNSCSGLGADAVFKGRTPKKIAELWNKQEHANWEQYKKEWERYPLTDSQMGVYLECVSEPESTMYNIPLCFSVEKRAGLDILKFEQALKDTALAYRILHVTIDASAKEPAMIKHLAGEVLVEWEQAEERHLADCKRKFVQPFDLEAGPLFRFKIIETEHTYEILADFHHIIFDGSSAEVFCRALCAAYEGKERKEETLDAFMLSAFDAEVSGCPEYKEAMQWFEKTMGGLEIDSNLIPDHRNAVRDQEPAGRYSIFLPEELSCSRVEHVTKELGITENTFFMGGFAYALSKASGGEECLFCSVNNGRHDPGFADTIGMLVRTLPLYIRCKEELTVAAYLASVQEGFFGAMSHDICHFSELASMLGISSDIMFVYQAELLNGFYMEDTFLEMETLEIAAQANLTVFVFKKQGGYEIRMEYCKHMYEEATIGRFAQLLGMVLNGFMQQTSLKDIPLIAEEEQQQMMDFNQTDMAYDESQTIVSMFRRIAESLPDHTAIVAENETLSYRELDELSERIAFCVHQKGLGREDVVSVLIKRNSMMAAAPLGIMKAGCAYQPLDASYPVERLNFMMKDAKSKLLICEESLRHLVDEYKGDVLYTADFRNVVLEGNCKLKGPAPEDLMVVLYTSGTTGTPKGCMLTQYNLVHFCEYYGHECGVGEHSIGAAYASFGFDANMMDVWGMLTFGGQVHVIGEEMRLDMMAMADYFREQRVNISFMTTQVGRAFAMHLAKHPCPELKTFLVGGETLVPFEPPQELRIYNAYGPTETSVYAAFYIVQHRMENIPIGKAVTNAKIYITDPWNRMMPIGVPGELVIAGHGVARGYLGRPELTAEKFTENPFCDKEGYRRIYHTGDIVRYLPDGNLEFIGRRDGQVKVRGFRIELTEVEGVIREYSGIKDATVIALDAPAGGKMVCAYIVAEERIDIEGLHAYIAEHKPPYMIPAVTMQIDKIPLNVNSKVDKRALPKPELKAEEIIPAETETQQRIYQIVKDVLGHEQFGITTDIYAAGLTSIGAVRLNVELSEAFGKAMRIKDLKANKTIRELEAFLDSKKVISALEKRDAYPLSHTQEGIFVECVANMDTTIYNIPFLMKLDEKTDILRLKKAIEDAVEAHPYLKTTMYMDENGDIFQKRNDGDKIEIEVIDGLAKEQLVRPFSLMTERLFRIAIHQAEANYLFMDFHHIICDGTTVLLFIQDVNRAYEGEVLKEEVYTGFDVAQEEHLLRKSESYIQAKTYYEKVFKGCDTDFLPARDGLGGEEKTGNLRYQTAGKAKELAAYCQKHQVTMNALFTAAFGLLISKYAYKEEAVFATIYDGRNDSRMIHTLGMLVKTLPVYCTVDGNQKIEEYIGDVKRQLMDSMENDVYSFGEISRAFGITADILFAYQGDNFAFDCIGGAKATNIPLPLNKAKEPINIDVFLEGDAVVYACEFREDMYSQSMMEGFLSAFAMIISEFSEKEYIKEVSMLSGQALEQLQAYNDTDVTIEPVTANILLERRAEMHPDQQAVIANGISYTFRELNEQANRIAHALRKMGLQTEALVGLMMERCVDVYAVRQGIMKAGAAFLTIDPDYPKERVDYILEDSGAPYLIVSSKTAKEKAKDLGTCSAKVLLLDDLLACSRVDNPVSTVTPENLAYSIYTSGSTGKPKGVMIRHRNLVNYVDHNPVNTEAAAYVQKAHVSLALAALTFDVSILEECIMLYNGITVCMANEEEIHNPLALSDLILNNHVDAFTCTPSYIMNIVDLEEMIPALQQIVLFNIGAESFPGSLYEKIQALGTDAWILNGYGPTETTIGCTLETITGGKVTIGRPMANMKMVMADRFGNILPAGVPGEMMILGNGVGRGYIGKPELTAEKFVTLLGLPAYHSGDMARWNYDGKIEFMGRIDNQVKLRGLRIELDEVETAMNGYDAVNSSVVIVKGEGEHQYLCGYFTASRTLPPKELQEYLGKTLTEYMVPSVLIQMDSLPLTSNGKVDKKALPEPGGINEKERVYKEPRTELEKELHAIFAFALGHGNFGIDENFFDLGGSSLSASKIAMKCMTKKIPVVYGDIFQYPTVERLSSFAEEHQDMQANRKNSTPVRESVPEELKKGSEKSFSIAVFDALSHNDVRYVEAVKKEEIGDILLTGATGFLGIHILYEYLKNYEGIAYCLIRENQEITAETRLESSLVYYFEDACEGLFGNRIQIIKGDITDADVIERLRKVPFDTLINCAACVKHFSADDKLERINVQGVRNMIAVCKGTKKRIIQISTTSVAGENVDHTFAENKKMKEHELFFGQSITNQYIQSKFRAEEDMLLAIAGGVRGKIIRVGNLMSRVRDGEFQMNSHMNGFMRMMRGYAAIGKFMVSGMDGDAEFSPIDSTAQAVLQLAGTNDEFTVFHACNSHLLQMADVITVLNERGLHVEVVSDNAFENALMEALDDKEKSARVSGLISYLSSDTEHTVSLMDADNRFTTKVLYRLGFQWPIIDSHYLKNAIQKLMELGYFEEFEQEDM